ncbi:hypothetical protein B9Z55_028788 [Caenorhabditis nigoni]|uniref:Uncharacterized protein n=1 Tax=Caenorhabditis nigoni TaxID=1611254 RepID=A0A2G5SAD3_9PELO|nr:hypothetical protein B9Z55_028788 [Caenorhabditis nigoni]
MKVSHFLRIIDLKTYIFKLKKWRIWFKRSIAEIVDGPLPGLPCQSRNLQILVLRCIVLDECPRQGSQLQRLSGLSSP